MYTVSSSWSRAVRSSGRRFHKAELYYGDPDVPIYSDLKISDFSIRADRRSNIRRTGTITIQDDAFFADLISSTPSVEPYGSEIKLYAGVDNPDGTEELVPLGVFVVEELSWNEGDTAVTVTCSDRSYLLSRRIPIAPQPGDPLVGSITTVQGFLSAIFAAIFPGVTLVIDPATRDVALQPDLSYEGSWLQTISALADLIQADAYFDVDGVFQVKPIPSVPLGALPGQEDWKIAAGDGGSLISASRKLSRRDTYNDMVLHVGLPGLSTDPSNVGEWLTGHFDNDPNSPTYYWGPFGASTMVLSFQYPASTDEFYAYIYERLDEAKSLSKTLDLSCLMNPALHEGDTILVQFLDGSEELHLVDSVSYSSSWISDISTRAQRVS